MSAKPVESKFSELSYVAGPVIFVQPGVGMFTWIKTVLELT
jgi:hypothetical protein